jgi:hypothetical protein
MNAILPPRVAAWLLETLGPADQESLVGDMHEEYARRKSSLWFWRQTLMAITLGAWREVQRDKLRAVGALFVGWLALALFAPNGARLMIGRPMPLALFVWRHLTVESYYVFAWLFSSAILSGAVVSRVARSNGMVLVFAGTIVAVTIGSLLLNEYTIAGATQLERDLYRGALPTAFLLGFMLLPTSILVGGVFGHPKPARTAVSR